MKKYNFIFPALMLAPIGALANNDLSYTSIEVDYVNMDIDGYDNDTHLLEDLDDGNGWGIRGSVGFANNWFAFLNYSSTESDAEFVDDFNQFVDSNTDIDRFNLGLGYHMPLNQRTDLVFSAAYVDIDIGGFDFGGTDDDSLSDLKDDNSDGFFVDGLLRSQLTQWLEGSIGGRYTDIEQVDNFSLIGNLLFEISPSIGINLGLDAGDELTTWVVGARFSI